MWMSELFGAKNIEFLKINVVSAGWRRLSQCGHFLDKGVGVNFTRFCATSLWTARNGKSLINTLENSWLFLAKRVILIDVNYVFWYFFYFKAILYEYNKLK